MVDLKLPPLAQAIASALKHDGEIVHLPAEAFERAATVLESIDLAADRDSEIKGLLVVAGRLARAEPKHVAKAFSQLIFLVLVAVHGRASAEELAAKDGLRAQAARLLDTDARNLPVSSTPGSRVFDLLVGGEKFFALHGVAQI